MRKLSLVIVLVFSMILTYGQDVDGKQQQGEENPETVKKSKGALYLSIDGGVGPSGLFYNLKDIYLQGESKLNISEKTLIGFSYFFNENVGIGSGVGVAYFRSSGLYRGDFDKTKYTNLGNQLMGIVQYPFELRVRFRNWEEIQTALYLEIPVLFHFKHKFGMKQMVGMYFNVGAKIQMPLMSKYEVVDGSSTKDERLNVSGYDRITGADMGSPGESPLTRRGLGSIYNPKEQLGWHDDLTLKMNVSGTAELGLLFALGRRVDMNLGAFIDYGFLNVKNEKSNKELLEAPLHYESDASDGKIGNGITYNGMLNSNSTDKVSLLSYGAKIGIRIRFGEIEATPWEKQQMRMAAQEGNNMAATRDLQKNVNEVITWKNIMEERISKLETGEKNVPVNPIAEPQPVNTEPTVTKATDTEVAGTIVKVEKTKKTRGKKKTKAINAKAMFRGIVSDIASGSPLLATVEVYDELGNLINLMASDANTGIFEIGGLPLGKNYTIKVQKTDYGAFIQKNIIVGKDNESSTRNFNIQLTKLEKGLSFSLKNVFFETAQTTLKQESMKEIDNLYQLLVDNPALKIEVSGHTDNVGSYKTNLKLSKNRAAAIVQALIDRGISADRLRSVGFGSDQPIDSNSTPEGRANNRRVEFKILEN